VDPANGEIDFRIGQEAISALGKPLAVAREEEEMSAAYLRRPATSTTTDSAMAAREHADGTAAESAEEEAADSLGPAVSCDLPRRGQRGQPRQPSIRYYAANNAGDRGGTAQAAQYQVLCG
jgi:hypothetical protein